MLRNFLASITQNGISIIGTALAIASLVLIVSLFVMHYLGFEGGPYLGILTFLILPAIFVLGLILIPIGALLYRRKLNRLHGDEHTPKLPVFDLNSPKTRGWMAVLLGATVLNIVIVAGATYKGVEVMESVEFCGQACHTVMQPEFTAYHRSPHSRVTCAECHIGPGADWFVKSKLDGAWQLVAVAFDLYPTPIPTPLENLRPARETCEQCHWPEKFVGDKLTVRRHYDTDEANTELTTALLLKVGGAEVGLSQGIHWHVDRGVEISYRSDETREEIYEVHYTDASGETKVYTREDAPLEEEGGHWRTMDCVDCHNRPSHKYYTPEHEVDRALRDGQIDRSLPFVKREAVRIIDAEFASHDEARSEISKQLAAYYGENHPEVAAEKAEAIETAGNVLGDLYSLNVFPEMKVWWNTYPEHIGHQQSEGCFRCHNRKLETAAGEKISRNCGLCHSVLAVEEEDPDLMTLLSP
jgi:hypothetical protein